MMESNSTTVLSRSTTEGVYDETACVICNSESGKTLTGTDGGRAKIQMAAAHLDDSLVMSRINTCSNTFQYHQKPKSCYSTYILKSKRSSKTNSEPEIAQIGVEEVEEGQSRYDPRKRRKITSFSDKEVDRKCVICDRARESIGTRNRVLYRISESDRATLFIDAINFYNDDVKTRCVFIDTAGDVFAADIFYHGNCLRQYLIKYQRHVDALFKNIERSNHAATVDINCKRVFDSLDFKTTSYSVTHICDLVNANLETDQHIDNRRTKVLVMKYFRDTVCFTYPDDRRTSQMVYSSSLLKGKIIETLRSSEKSGPQKCAMELLNECKNYEFGLDATYCTNEDVKISMDRYKSHRPQQWMQFMKYMFPNTINTNTDEWLLKFDTLFQMIKYWLSSGRSKTPLHCSLTQTVHNLSRSRQLIDIMNRLNLAISYDSMKRMNTSAAQKMVEDTLPNRCPVSSMISEWHVVQGAMDNFDHAENTVSGKDSSHDTVLVIFQNQPIDSYSEENRMTSSSTPLGKRKFADELPCQVIEKSHLVKGTGDIPQTFSTTPYIDKRKHSVDDDYFLWCMARHKYTGHEEVSYPSFTATMSALQDPLKFYVTKKSFVPILPYVATEMDTIFTSMINFQDVLKQKNAVSGALWSDEGVYAIAKEIQLLKPDQFSNIFLGMGPFHMEKIVIACLGKFLDCIGISLALVETEAFGKLVVENSVMTGAHYCKGKEAMSLISEVITVLMFEQFQADQDSTSCELDEQIQIMVTKMQRALDVERKEFKDIWEESKMLNTDLKKYFTEWKETACNDNVTYWSLFLDELYPILRDLTHSTRQGDWHLFVSVVRRCMPLFFGFGRTNYSRWGTLFLEDCLDIQRKFPDIYSCFNNGGWVMYHTLRQGSAVGFDMALEKCYNKPAKVAGGIIGMTRRKEAVALWNLLKHEKDLHVAQLLEWCNLGDKDDSELSLHHEFNPSSTKIGHVRAKTLLNYINSINNPFGTGSRLHNICTGVEIPQEAVDGLFECLKIGENSYQEFIHTRFDEKEKHLHDTIPTNRKTVFVKCNSTEPQAKKSMAKKDAAETIRYIDYARERGYSMLELLKYELTSTSQFLTTECEDGIKLKKPDKASLSRELVSQLPQEMRNVRSDAQMTVVDFMALVRKLPVHKMGIQTFGELAETISNSILATGSESTRIDIIFDVYQKSSIKQLERARRSSSQQITITIRSSNQKLPVDLSMFWSSMLNKVRLQEYVFNWMMQNVKSEKEIFFGGLYGGECRKLLAGSQTEITELSSNQEEADDRIMFHINDGVVKYGVKSVLVDSPDTDVFVNLIYHFNKTWQLDKLYVTLGKSKTKKTVPVHLLVHQLDNVLMSCLPAIHALSGCDSTSKVGPKLFGLKTSVDLSLLEGFGAEELSPQMISNAEKFLVSGFKKTDCSTFDEYRWEQYHNLKKELDFNQLVCCSSTIHEHIKRAYLQCYMWLQASTPAVTIPDPLQYGYEAMDGGITPLILPVSCRPNDLPPPCRCPTSCLSTKTCICREMNMKCVTFCGCSKAQKCRNPNL